MLKSSPLLQTRDGERAHVSVNGKQCWSRTFHYSKGAKVCGVGWNDETFKVAGCTGTLSKAGPLTVRVWTTIDQDARDESFGIDNVVVTYYGAKPKPKPGVAQTPTLTLAYES